MLFVHLDLPTLQGRVLDVDSILSILFSEPLEARGIWYCYFRMRHSLLLPKNSPGGT